MKDKSIVFDFELVFDVWSLLFCVARSQLGKAKKALPVKLNYDIIVNSSIELAAKQICLRHLEEEERDAIGKEIVNQFELNLTTVKPWIPYFQLIEWLQGAGA